MDRKIIHIDLDAFFCSVEELYNPSLKGTPFAVGGSPKERGVISSCSYAARQLGIHSAMPSSKALKLYPKLEIIHPRHHQYLQISNQVMALVRDISPYVEQISVDEAFIDVSDIREDGRILAQQLQNTIQDKLNLPCSLGVASNKLVAKIANNVGKKLKPGNQPPKAISVVPPGHEASFLAPLPVSMLWGVGPKTSLQLEEIGIRTIGDLANWNEADLINRFGIIGSELKIRAQGKDDRLISLFQEVKSISQEMTFPQDINDVDILKKTIVNLGEQVGQRLRQSGMHCTTIKLKVRWQDFQTLSRQITLDNPTDQDTVIITWAWQLFESVWKTTKMVRLLGVGVSNLIISPIQLSFWDTTLLKDKQLQKAIDQIRNRYGKQIIKRGVSSNHPNK